MQKTTKGQPNRVMIFAGTAVALLGAIALFIVVGLLEVTLISRIAIIVMGVLLLAIAAILAVLGVFPVQTTVNYFLYDEATGRNASPDALTEELVATRVDAYVARLVRKKSELWLPGRLVGSQFGDNGQFAPLVAYKMLIDLGEADSDGAWRCFCASAPETVKWIADTLQPLEPNMTKDLMAVKMRFGNDPAKVRGFILHNMKYMKGRMLQYTHRTIEEFNDIE